MHYRWVLGLMLLFISSLCIHILLELCLIKCEITPLFNTKGYIIRTEGCMIPNIDPCDPSIIEYIRKRETIDCRNGTPIMIYSNASTIHLNQTALYIMGLKPSQINCSYCPYSRSFPSDEFKQCHVFNTKADIKKDYVTVYCEYNVNGEYRRYQDFFSFLHPVKRRSSASHDINVLVIGLDGLSRINFHRQMPLTSKVMRKLEAIEFMGYNKVGENSYPNLMPVLTGLSNNDIEKSCSNFSYFYDNCSWIWNTYRDKKYTTMFADDSWMTELFQKPKLLVQPTDYYWSPFSVLRPDINVKDKCIGVKSMFKLILDYGFQFVNTMSLRSESYFGFIWTESGTHSDVNSAQLVDQDLSTFVRDLMHNGLLYDTVLILMADHGIRYGEYRKTAEGSIEDQLPLLNIYLPIWFRTHYSKSFHTMLENSRKLTTHYDLHETLLALADIANIGTKPQSSITDRKYSLFNTIPENRTCTDALISPKYCACHDNEMIDVTDDLAYEIAHFVAQPELTPFPISKILHFRKHIYNNQECLKFEDYTILFKADVRYFEATVRRIFTGHGYKIILIDEVYILNVFEYNNYLIDFSPKDMGNYDNNQLDEAD